jgi:ubiquinone/menaquinone biosynthesis C-methylase UbiE
MDSRQKKFIGSGRCVVDLGCGAGDMLNALAGEFEQRIGLDAFTVRLEQSDSAHTRDWEHRIADLNLPFPLETESVDAVMANQVIEHIVDPVRFVAEIHRVLRPGGRCMITTPNIRYLRNIAHLLFSGHGPRTANGVRLEGDWDGGHIHYFTHRDLTETCAEVGFRDIQSRALIDLSGNSAVRKLFDRHASNHLVREFLSGNIMLQAIK